MGCDIHTLLERKFDYKDRGWANVDYWKYNAYYDENSEYEDKFELEDFYDNRNYELFAILADVRNYNDVKCIQEPKGTPIDCDKVTKDYIDKWGADGHSHSYFTLKELYNYWLKTVNKKTKRKGILIGDILDKFDNEGIEPTEWCQACSTTLKHAWREWETEYNPLDNFMNNLIDRFCKEFWIFYIKQEEYKTSEKLKNEIEEKGDDFRVIFFFDN